MTVRGCGVAVLMAMAMAASAGAQPATPTTARAYPSLESLKIRPERNALQIFAACSACSNTPAFCQSSLENKAPSADVLTQWQNKKCSASDASVAAMSAAEKAAAQKAKTIVLEGSTLLGTSWQADVLNGVAEFLEARAKAELLASLISHVQDDLCKQDKFKGYLPATCALIGSADPYATPIAWSALKAAIETDLRALPQSLVTKFFKDQDKAQPLIALAEVAVLIARGADPLETLAGLQNKYATINSVELCKAYPFACGLRLFGEAVEVFSQPPPLALERNAASLERYLKIAARLLYDANDVESPLVSLVTPSKLATLSPKLTAFGQALLTVNTAAADAHDTSGSKSVAPFNAYARSVANVFDFDVIGEIYPSIKQAITGDNLKTALDDLELAFEHARAGEYVESFAELNAALAAVELTPPGWFTKYGGFLAEVAAAKSADDAQKAFEAAAAPVGSWRQKRGSGHRIVTLNAYMGVQGGGEWLSGNGVASNQSWQGGLFAPIGLEGSLGFCKSSSISLLLSVLDLGALVDFRPSSTDSSTNSNVGFRQVFSPGVYAVYGIPGVPLSFGAGASLAPELRSVDVGGGSTQDVNALRLSVFFAVDVTILGL